jgi:hypothetical protein
MAVMNFKASCLNFDTATTWAQVTGGDLTVESSAVDCTTNFLDDTTDLESAYFNGVSSNATGDFDLEDQLNTTAPDFMPSSGSILLGAGETPPSDGFFTAVDFIGAVGPGQDWVADGLADGWIAMDVD